LKTDTANHPRSGNIVAFDRARTFVVLLVVIYHAASNYQYFGHGDHHRWIGFDVFVLLADSFFMPLMFFISGLFVWPSLHRKGATIFLRNRLRRLGMPYLVSIFIVVPIAYYPSFLLYHLPGTTDFNFLHFCKRTFTAGPWPSGPAWFLWVLLLFNAGFASIAYIIPAALGRIRRILDTHRDRPAMILTGLALLTIAIYLPSRLAFGPDDWLAFGPVSVQSSRILLYLTYFILGTAVGTSTLDRGLFEENSTFARRWAAWLTFALVLFYALAAMIFTKASSPGTVPHQIIEGCCLSVFCAAMSFAVLAVAVRFSKSCNAAWRFLDAMTPVAYGIFLMHFIFIMWLQYALYSLQLPAIAKFAAVLTGTLGLSWALARILRMVPIVARTI